MKAPRKSQGPGGGPLHLPPSHPLSIFRKISLREAAYKKKVARTAPEGPRRWSSSAANQGLRVSQRRHARWLCPREQPLQWAAAASSPGQRPSRGRITCRRPSREGAWTSPAQLQVRVVAQLLCQLFLRGLLQDIPAESGTGWLGSPGHLQRSRGAALMQQPRQCSGRGAPQDHSPGTQVHLWDAYVASLKAREDTSPRGRNNTANAQRRQCDHPGLTLGRLSLLCTSRGTISRLPWRREGRGFLGPPVYTHQQNHLETTGT